MASVVDDLAADVELDRAYVERRVDDWRNRINALYRDVDRWLPSEYSTRLGLSIVWNEQMMQHHNVAPVKLYSLEIHQNDRLIGKLTPRKLWIIGANGRIDFTKGESYYIIVDRSNEIGVVDWHIAPAERRRDQRRLDEAVWRDVLTA